MVHSLSRSFYPLIHTALLPGNPWVRHVKHLGVRGVYTFRNCDALETPTPSICRPDEPGGVDLFPTLRGICLSYNSYYGYDDIPGFLADRATKFWWTRSRLLRPSVILPMSVIAGLLSAAAR